MSTPVVIALGSNLGDRLYYLRRAIHELTRVVTLVRLSSTWTTSPVDAPPGSPPFLNMVALGFTPGPPDELIGQLLETEARLGRVRGRRNAPRTIDLDLILYGATLVRSPRLVLPHPRYREREFVLAPLRELALPWHDPQTGIPLEAL